MISEKLQRKALQTLICKASVEHRGVEPLTSTMRMSRATICANAPFGNISDQILHCVLWSDSRPSGITVADLRPTICANAP